jgi:hypothetical protein
MRKYAIVIVVASLFASTAAISVKHQRRWVEKLDASLVQVAQQRDANVIHVMILVRPGSSDRIVSHLVEHGLKPEHAAVPDIVTVRIPTSMLRSIGGDPDVVHLCQMH